MAPAFSTCGFQFSTEAGGFGGHLPQQGLPVTQVVDFR
jgi:hypothetical protein